MPYPILADIMSVLKDVMAALGSLGAVAFGAFGIWHVLKKRAEKKRKKEREDDIELSTKFARLEVQVDHLQEATDSIERQYMKFREGAMREQQELGKQIDELRTRSDQYEKTADDIQRMGEQLKRLEEDLRRLRDTVLEKYLTISSYQNDLIMWTKSFDDLRQSLRDVHLTLNKRSR